MPSNYGKLIQFCPRRLCNRIEHLLPTASLGIEAAQRRTQLGTYKAAELVREGGGGASRRSGRRTS
eukprot:2790767-Amphidinium_carterae.1